MESNKLDTVKYVSGKRKGLSILIKILKYIRENNAMYWSLIPCRYYHGYSNSNTFCSDGYMETLKIMIFLLFIYLLNPSLRLPYTGKFLRHFIFTIFANFAQFALKRLL